MYHEVGFQNSCRLQQVKYAYRYLINRYFKKARVVAFEDLGMEAIYEFEVEDMPVTVAVDSTGSNAHQIGPDTWKVKIQEMEDQ